MVFHHHNCGMYLDDEYLEFAHKLLGEVHTAFLK